LTQPDWLINPPKRLFFLLQVYGSYDTTTMNNFTVPFLAWMTLLLGLGQMTFTIEAAALSSSSSTSTSFSSSARKRRKMPAMEFWLAAKVTEAQHEMEAQR
jgi:hypothetical protein